MSNLATSAIESNFEERSPSERAGLGEWAQRTSDCDLEYDVWLTAAELAAKTRSDDDAGVRENLDVPIPAAFRRASLKGEGGVSVAALVQHFRDAAISREASHLYRKLGIPRRAKSERRVLRHCIACPGLSPEERDRDLGEQPGFTRLILFRLRARAARVNRLPFKGLPLHR